MEKNINKAYLDMLNYSIAYYELRYQKYMDLYTNKEIDYGEKSYKIPNLEQVISKLVELKHELEKAKK